MNFALVLYCLPCFHPDCRAMVPSNRLERLDQAIFLLENQGLCDLKAIQINVGLPLNADESLPTHGRQHHAEAPRLRHAVCQGLSAMRCQSGTQESLREEGDLVIRCLTKRLDRSDSRLAATGIAILSFRACNPLFRKT